MKNLILLVTDILLAVSAPFQANAQFNILKFESSTSGKDTIRVYATQNRTMQLSLGGYYDAVAVTSTIERVGGVTLAGTYKLQKRLHSAAGWTDVPSTSYTVTNTTSQPVSWDLPAGIYGELQVVYTGSGTGTGIAKSWASAFKRK